VADPGASDIRRDRWTGPIDIAPGRAEMAADVDAGPVEDLGLTETELFLGLDGADFAVEIGRLSRRDASGAHQRQQTYCRQRCERTNATLPLTRRLNPRPT
jgi:hypothetical protein